MMAPAAVWCAEFPSSGRSRWRTAASRRPVRSRCRRAASPAARLDADRRRPGRYCYLFDVDEELAGDLDLRMRLVARPMVAARVEQISAGEFDLIPLLAQLRGGLGLLLIEGVVALDVQVGDRTASELVGAGDLLAPWTSAADVVLLASETFSRALVRTRVAILDAGVRRAHPAVAADPARAAAARGAPDDGAQRPPRGDMPPARGRAHRAAAVAPGRALGDRRRRTASWCRCR